MGAEFPQGGLATLQRSKYKTCPHPSLNKPYHIPRSKRESVIKSMNLMGLNWFGIPREGPLMRKIKRMNVSVFRQFLSRILRTPDQIPEYLKTIFQEMEEVLLDFERYKRGLTVTFMLWEETPPYKPDDSSVKSFKMAIKGYEHRGENFWIGCYFDFDETRENRIIHKVGVSINSNKDWIGEIDRLKTKAPPFNDPLLVWGDYVYPYPYQPVEQQK